MLRWVILLFCIQPFFGQDAGGVSGTAGSKTPLSCNTGSNYVRFVKKTMEYSGEESFAILSDSSVIYTSPGFIDNNTTEWETCLAGSTNSQYTLQMKDSGSNGWSNGAWIEVYGIDDNIVFQGLQRSNLPPYSQYSGGMPHTGHSSTSFRGADMWGR